ncbi:MAG: CBS domain-containing protein [Magnetospirillum sp.]|nr:CBS domain-containing protein [Magnetospirillum sp.]
MTVETILKSKGRDTYTIRPDQALIEAADLLAEHRIGATMVCEGSKLVGVLSERDVVRGLNRSRTAALTQPIRMFMSSPVITCDPKDKIKDIMEVMSLRRIRHLPVVRDGQIMGMISIGDVINHRLQQKQMEIAVLRDYAIAVR